MADAPLGGLWIRRQVFEHSVAVPLLTSTSAAQIDFTKLATELAACSVYMDASNPPAVSYADWVAMAGLHARLDSSDDACVIIEALETNTPAAFVRCNDPDKLAPGRQLNYRQLNIPVPELLAFLRLHAAATMASRFRETCNASWPDAESSPPSAASNTANQPSVGSPISLNVGARPTLSPLPMSLMTSTSPTPGTAPMSPRVAQRSSGGTPISPLMGTQAGNVPPGSPGGTTTPSTPGTLDGLVRKKTPTHLAAMVKSQSAILASVQNSLLRETELVSRNITHLLEVIAASYGLVPAVKKKGEDGNRGVAMEKGKLVRVNSDRKRNDTSDAKRAAIRNLEVTKEMFEHLSFLLTTNVSPEGSRRSIASIVPQWRDGDGTMRLGDLVDIVRAALARETPADGDDDTPIDVAEFVDLDKKTILRSSFPDCNLPGQTYPHGREVRISNCSGSNLYLLAALGRVSLIACRDCTLFIGACVSVSIINCVNVSVHAVARVCRVTNCFDTQLYLCTNRAPQIVGDNRGLVFAPYNAAYPNVARDMAEIGVVPSPNVWDAFYRPAYRSDRGSADPDLTPAVATVLPPEKFIPFAVPVKTTSRNSGGKTENRGGLFNVPLPLPPEYATGLAARKHEIDLVRREICTLDAVLASKAAETGKLVDAGRGILQSIVQDRFREWLFTSGNMRQISELTKEQEVNVNGESRAKTPERPVR